MPYAAYYGTNKRALRETKKKKKKPALSMKNAEGGGEPEGWRRTERRVETGWEGRNKWRGGER